MATNIEDADKRAPSKSFEDATALLSDPAALRLKAQTNGYLFFKGLLPKQKVLSLRTDILGILQRRGWLDSSQPLTEGIADLDAVNGLSSEETNWNGVGVPMDVYREVQKLESFHALAHEPRLLQMYETLFGRKPFPHPRNIGRIMLPHSGLNVTPAHQDFLHIQGAEETWTCWAPLGDCPQQLGGLMILEGSHRAGLLGVTQAPGAGGLESILCGLGYEWVAGDYETGDVVTFHSHTVHKAQPNATRNRVRLSCDFRYQPIDQPIEERSLLPHGPYDWNDLYEGWHREDLKYYWKTFQLARSPWDESIRWQKDKIC